MLSIIIPAKNEEKHIGKLLSSIRKQSFKDYEIIVADAKSTDKTREIAKKYGAKVVNGGMPGPGRNRGAEVAKGKDLCFIDSDAIIPKDFLKKNYGEFIKKDLDVAAALLDPLSTKLIDKLIHHHINLFYVVFQKISPGAMGINIFAKKKWFDKVKGFDEKIYFAEDYHFVQKIWKAGGKFGPLMSSKIRVSVRRLEKEGRLKFIAQGIYSLAYQHLIGPMYPGSIKYEFDAHKK